MLNDLIPIVLFYFLYSFVMTIVKNTHRKNTMKMLIDNNLMNTGENCINFKFMSSEQNSSNNNYTLAVALGLMGCALGLICAAYMIVGLSGCDTKIDNHSWYDIKDAIQLGMPLFFASIGVTIAYFIERRK